MVARECTAAMFPVATLVLTQFVLAAETPPDKPHTFNQCYLIRGNDGHLWFRQPIVVFGMWGTKANAPVYRMSERLARRFEPLMTQVAEPTADYTLAVPGLPKLKAGGDAVILLDLETNLRLTERTPDIQPDVYEVVSARVTRAEFITREWLDAWHDLRRIPMPFAAPDVGMTKRLREQEPQIRQSLEALDKLARQWSDGGGPRDQHRAALNKVQFEARIVRLFQSRVVRDLRKHLTQEGITLPERDTEQLGGYHRRTIEEGITLPERDTDADGAREQLFGPCYLYRDLQGQLGLCHPMIYLGMWGVMMPPEYRFSSELAARLGPLVTELDDTSGLRSFHAGNLPRPRSDDTPIVLLRFHAKTKPVGKRSAVTLPSGPASIPRDVYEITSAKITEAEFVTRAWFDRWRALHAVLDKIVEISRRPPADDKRRRLAEQIEKGARAIHSMADAGVIPSVNKKVRDIEPSVRIVTSLQDRVATEWGRELARYAKRLRISPKTPMPDFAEPAASTVFNPIQTLADSVSAQTFMSRVRETCPPDRIKQELLFSCKIDRRVEIWEIESVPAEIFEILRAEARQQVEQEAVKRQKPLETVQEQWNVTIKPADEALLARKLVLRGTLVDKLVGAGPRIGLQAGDLIIDYARVYDLHTAGDNWHWPVQHLAAIAHRGGQLTVLRDDRLMEIEVPKRE